MPSQTSVTFLFIMYRRVPMNKICTFIVYTLFSPKAYNWVYWIEMIINLKILLWKFCIWMICNCIYYTSIISRFRQAISDIYVETLFLSLKNWQVWINFKFEYCSSLPQYTRIIYLHRCEWGGVREGRWTWGWLSGRCPSSRPTRGRFRPHSIATRVT